MDVAFCYLKPAFDFQDDYRQSVRELDEKEYFSLRLTSAELRNHYVSIRLFHFLCSYLKLAADLACTFFCHVCIYIGSLAMS